MELIGISITVDQMTNCVGYSVKIIVIVYIPLVENQHKILETYQYKLQY